MQDFWNIAAIKASELFGLCSDKYNMYNTFPINVIDNC